MCDCFRVSVNVEYNRYNRDSSRILEFFFYTPIFLFYNAIVIASLKYLDDTAQWRSRRDREGAARTPRFNQLAECMTVFGVYKCVCGANRCSNLSARFSARHVPLRLLVSIWLPVAEVTHPNGQQRVSQFFARAAFLAARSSPTQQLAWCVGCRLVCGPKETSSRQGSPSTHTHSLIETNPLGPTGDTQHEASRRRSDLKLCVACRARAPLEVTSSARARRVHRKTLLLGAFDVRRIQRARTVDWVLGPVLTAFGDRGWSNVLWRPSPRRVGIVWTRFLARYFHSARLSTRR